MESSPLPLPPSLTTKPPTPHSPPPVPNRINSPNPSSSPPPSPPSVPNRINSPNPSSFSPPSPPSVPNRINSPNPSSSPPPPPTTLVVNRVTWADPKPKPNPNPRTVEDGERDPPPDHRERERESRVVTGIVRRSRREASVTRASVGVRVAAAVLALISFSVMAADKTKGWAGDSFDRYKEYRYCISVNVIAFVYSSFQIYAHVHHMMKGKDIIKTPTRYYFDFSMDQILAYLLLSASSSAVARNDDWVSNWGSDPFTVMINGSISMSFLAFFAFALSSLISAYSLFGSCVQ